MKQVLQNLSSGETALHEVPPPRLDPGCVLVQTSCSLISAGTERMLVEFGRASMIAKARLQPERVRTVLDKVRTDGVLATLEAVRSKLDQPLALGYCNAGVVLDVGAGVTEFKAGDRVASNGAHASIVSVPKHLCALIPDNVDDPSAAFTVPAAIGLHGMRLAQPTLGEVFVVTGLGLIGQLTIQLLRANGCKVLGIDIDPARLKLAQAMGARTVNPAAGEDPLTEAIAISGGTGVDAVIITASTKSSEPISQAAQMCRKRGRIVMIGVTGMELNRTDFYEKELSFQVSCSYGPGRYDPQYEDEGHDYPVGFVRWTEQRNFEAVLNLLAQGQLDVRPLISRRYGLDDATLAYDQLAADPALLGVLLEYPTSDQAAQLQRRVVLTSVPTSARTGNDPVVGFIGAGNYGSRVLIPAFRAAGAQLDTLVTNSGASGAYHGRRMGFSFASTQIEDVLNSTRINTVAIATRHNTHANLVIQALQAGKNVFVEKPLALTLADVDAIEAALNASHLRGSQVKLMVGFNRRFAPLISRMKALLDAVRQPKAFIYSCSAGFVPSNHWTQDPLVGGGRIIGEACHFVDLLRYLAGSPIAEFRIVTMGRHPTMMTTSDKALISLRFEDGSIGAIQYLANGGRVFPKERIEVVAGDAVLQLENFVTLRGFGWKGFRKSRNWRQDKGQAACAAAFLDSVRAGSPSPVPTHEILEVARVSIQLAQMQLDG